MAADPQTEAYRQTTSTVASGATLYAMAQMQQTVDLASLLPSFNAWLEKVEPVIVAASRQTVSLARADYELTRRLEVAGNAGSYEWQPQWLNTEALRRSMYATAGQTLQRVERFQIPPGVALKRAQVQAGGVTTRYVMNAARNSTIATTKTDDRALGALYVTRGDDKVCYWCAMLASRGPVFGTDSFDDSDRQFNGDLGTAKSHDGCRCVLKTVYSSGSPLLDESHRLEAMWRDVNWHEGWRDDPSRGRIKNSGKKALAEFRKVWEARA